MNEPKLCKDCLHFRESHPIAGSPKCAAPQYPTVPDLVYGRRPLASAFMMRATPNFCCGPEAKWFLAK